MSNHFNANLHQYNNVHATLSHAMFWETLSQPTEWVIAISCKSYCLRKECCIFYSHPTPRMAGFWKGGFGFSSKKVRTKKNPSDFIFQRALAQIWGLGEEGLDKKWMSQVLNLVACVGSISNRVIARKLEWEQKKNGRGKGRRGNACPETLRFRKSPLDISRFCSFVNWQLVKIEASITDYCKFSNNTSSTRNCYTRLKLWAIGEEFLIFYC